VTAWHEEYFADEGYAVSGWESDRSDSQEYFDRYEDCIYDIEGRCVTDDRDYYQLCAYDVDGISRCFLVHEDTADSITGMNYDIEREARIIEDRVDDVSYVRRTYGPEAPDTYYTDTYSYYERDDQYPDQYHTRQSDNVMVWENGNVYREVDGVWYRQRDDMLYPLDTPGWDLPEDQLRRAERDVRYVDQESIYFVR